MAHEIGQLWSIATAEHCNHGARRCCQCLPKHQHLVPEPGHFVDLNCTSWTHLFDGWPHADGNSFQNELRLETLVLLQDIGITVQPSTRSSIKFAATSARRLAFNMWLHWQCFTYVGTFPVAFTNRNCLSTLSCHMFYPQIKNPGYIRVTNFDLGFFVIKEIFWNQSFQKNWRRKARVVTTILLTIWRSLQSNVDALIRAKRVVYVTISNMRVIHVKFNLGR